MLAICVLSSGDHGAGRSSLCVRLKTPSSARGRWRTSCFGFFCLVLCLLGNGAAQTSATQLDKSISQQTLEKRLRDPVPAYVPTPAEPIEPRIERYRPSTAPQFDDFRISQKCADGLVNPTTCKFHWRPALSQLGEFLVIETGWNLATNYWVREATFRGPWLKDYFNSVSGFSFSRWTDDNPWYDDYVGHPMMGAVAMDIYIHNDPRGKSLELQNTKAYWHSRLRALLWSTLYSAQWKLGPISEASIGNTGRAVIYDHGKWTNGTGTVGLVVTPVGGWVWNVAEDITDQRLITRLEKKSQNPLFLFTIQFLNPCRGFSNLLRFKAPWYRDSRPVRSDPRIGIKQSNHELVASPTGSAPIFAEPSIKP
jgi:hypothetical protein